ncbi:MAG: hypothetical protein DSM106950_30145 [Stigonema ocellatum SAG 48.90 = DSM 106950]|nr:hypothetical protein [Stigonema ocellatum SAG 48.90 = DSM 106950]
MLRKISVITFLVASSVLNCNVSQLLAQQAPLTAPNTSNLNPLTVDPALISDESAKVLYASDSNPAAKFRFTKLADTANEFTSFGSVALNNQGVVAFSAAVDESGSWGIYTTDGQAITKIVDSDALSNLFADILPSVAQDSVTVSGFSLGGVYAINNVGSVFFGAVANIQPGASSNYRSAYQKLFLSQGDTINSVGYSYAYNTKTGSITSNFNYTGAGVNDNGQVVYSDYFSNEASPTDVSAGTMIDRNGQNLASATSISYRNLVPQGQVSLPVINNQGTVFYYGSGSIGNGNPITANTNNIFRVGSGDSTSVAVSPLLGDVKSLAANDQGDIVFSGSLTSGETGLFLINNGVITEVNNQQGNAKINNQRLIAFQPSPTPTTPTGIFTISNGVLQKVIAPGDPLLGSIVADVQFGGLNDAGEIAFVASLTDGTKGIFRAHPIRKQHLKVS